MQQPQVATVAAAEPKTVSYTPTTYVAAPAAEPLFFNRMMGGMGSYGWLGSNNMGGKVVFFFYTVQGVSSGRVHWLGRL